MYHFAYAFGGKPNSTVTYLVDPHSRNRCSTMYRPLDPSMGNNDGKHHETGLDVKLKENYNMTTFRRDAWQHLQKYGLDTITYPNNLLELTKLNR